MYSIRAMVWNYERRQYDSVGEMLYMFYSKRDAIAKYKADKGLKNKRGVELCINGDWTC